MPNTQPISKQNLVSNGLLELHHMFLTIQGEGPFAGTPAVFVRLFGCNLQCPFCDTDYTSEKLQVTPDYVINKATEFFGEQKGLIVFSGGEPFRQNISPAAKLLVEAGFTVQVETNGTLPPSPDLPDEVVIVCSPKTGSINKDLTPRIDALKYVIHADSLDTDGLPIMALGHTAKPTAAKPPTGFTGDVFVQPIDVDNPVENVRHLDAAIRSCMTFGYRLCVQIHKIINME